MGFREEVAGTPGLETAYRKGLQALTEADRNRLTIESPKTIAGSVDVDTELRSTFPQAPRWDYVVAVSIGRRQVRLEWIEVHPATTTANVEEVCAKHDWLRHWLGGDGDRLDRYPRDFIWISTGKTSFHAGAPQLRRLAARGLRLAGRHHRIA